MKDAIIVKCDCGCANFVVYKYEDASLDYIECAKCGENIDWNRKKPKPPKGRLIKNGKLRKAQRV